MSASTAEWIGLIRNAEMNADGQPLDAVRARALRSNLCHQADSFGQVRCNWTASPSFGIEPIDLVPVASLSERGAYVLSVGPWPVPLRHDGEPFRLRVGIAAHVPAEHVDLYLVYGPARPTPPNPYYPSSYAILSGIANTSPAWQDAVLLEMSAAQARECVSAVSTIDEDGDPAAVEQCLVALHVYAIGPEPEAWIDGLYVAEWQGDVG